MVRSVTLGLLLACLALPAYASVAYIEEGNDSEALSADATLMGAGRLAGFSIRESAGTPAVATVILRNASDTDTGTGGVQCAESGGTTQVGGAAVAYIELAANQSVNMNYDRSISVPLGLCADIVAGEVDIQVYFTLD